MKGRDVSPWRSETVTEPRLAKAELVTCEDCGHAHYSFASCAIEEEEPDEPFDPLEVPRKRR